MKVSVSQPAVSIRMTDDEARLLIQRLQARLTQREAVLAVAPELKTWSDHVHSFDSQFGLEPGGHIHFSICAV